MMIIIPSNDPEEHASVYLEILPSYHGFNLDKEKCISILQEEQKMLARHNEATEKLEKALAKSANIDEVFDIILQTDPELADTLLTAYFNAYENSKGTESTQEARRRMGLRYAEELGLIL